MRTRGHHRTGAVALAGLVIAIGAAAPAHAAERPQLQHQLQHQSQHQGQHQGQHQSSRALQVSTDESEADHGVLAAAITTGAGDTVAWRLVDDRGVAILSGQYVADGTEQRLDRQVAEGRYELEVTATDAMGNATAETVTTGVTARPMVNPDVLPVLRIVLGLWLLVSAGYHLRRRSRRRGAVALPEELVAPRPDEPASCDRPARPVEARELVLQA